MLAHLVDDAKTAQLGFIRHLVAVSFDFDRCNSSGILRERADNPKHTLAEFRAVLGRTTSTPAPLSTRLVEIFVHAEDIRRPLGINYGYQAHPFLRRHRLTGRLRFRFLRHSIKCRHHGTFPARPKSSASGRKHRLRDRPNLQTRPLANRRSKRCGLTPNGVRPHLRSPGCPAVRVSRRAVPSPPCR